MRFDNVQIEWRIAAIERDVQHKADRHEISSLRSIVDSLERTNREICSDIAWLCAELQELQASITHIKESLNEG